MKIAILLYPGVTALDAIGPYEVLSRVPGARVYFVAREAGPVVTDTGMLTLLPELTLNEMPEPDVLLIPGALESFRAVMADAETLSWIRSVHETSQWTTSVCSGALILAAAGLLQGLEATTHWAAAPGLEQFGATYTPKRVVRQGKIMTAAGVSAGIDMALTLAAELKGRETAESIQLVIEYDPQPPFDAGAPHKASQAVLAQAKGLLGGR
jgi:putative intracellular protease/amidase